MVRPVPPYRRAPGYCRARSGTCGHQRLGPRAVAAIRGQMTAAVWYSERGVARAPAGDFFTRSSLPERELGQRKG